MVYVWSAIGPGSALCPKLRAGKASQEPQRISLLCFSGRWRWSIAGHIVGENRLKLAQNYKKCQKYSKISKNQERQGLLCFSGRWRWSIAGHITGNISPPVNNGNERLQQNTLYLFKLWFLESSHSLYSRIFNQIHVCSSWSQWSSKLGWESGTK